MKTPKKHPGGRPTIYTKDLGDRILHELAQGKSLRTVCKAEDMPDAASVFRWLRVDKEFCEQYTRAKEESADALNETLLDLGDDAITLSQGVEKHASNAVVQAVKLKADNLKWVMSKLKPKKYGDKMDVTTDGEKIQIPIYGGKSIQRHDGDSKDIQPNKTN